jgi:endoglucanase
MPVAPALLRLRRATTVALLLTLAVTGSGIALTGERAQAAVPQGNVFAGARLFVDPASPAAGAAAAVRTSDPATAQMLDKVARGASVDWFTGSIPTSTLTASVARRAATIRAAGALPVFVVYNIPFRDCGSYSGGGARSAPEYAAWIKAFTAGLGQGRVAVIVEPDALAQMTCLTAHRQKERLALVKYAVATLGSRPGTAVYIDAGHSGWIAPKTMAQRLAAAGVRYARGFSLNVSFFNYASIETTYGRTVSAALGGSHFVIDTSRNGRGPSADRAWCNPAGRGLGVLPGTRPVIPQIDAYLWVKHPGFSDGTCNGGPTAGAWWATYARALASSANW